MSGTLVVRPDNAGDVLLAGPAVRAVAATDGPVTMLTGPNGADAARLLPGVHDVLVHRLPWIDPTPEPVDRALVVDLVGVLARRALDRALVLTSFHQSALPTALLLRLAGVPWVGAVSEDYPGSLLDLRHHVDDDIPEVERGLSLAAAAGYPLPRADDGSLAVRRPLPDVTGLLPAGAFVVLHPGTSVPARAWPVDRFADAARSLVEEGYAVVVTGGADERALCRAVVGSTPAVDLSGTTTLAELAAVVDAASAVVVANTGPAHLAAAVGTPVVSLFAPTVPAVRWAPYRVPHVLLGDQQAPCRDSRATRCPVPGHPCLRSVGATDVVAAVDRLARETSRFHHPPRLPSGSPT